MYILPTYTDDSELQTIIAPPIISAFYKSLHAKSSPDVSWQRILMVEILQLHALKSSLHSLSYKTDQVAPAVFKITSR
jgi:hypothetical protein